MAGGRTMGLAGWLLLLVLVIGFRSGLGDITVSMEKTVSGYKGESVVIPCTYTTSNNEEVVKIEWEFGNNPVIYRSESEDHILLVKYRTRASMSKSSAGDVSLTLNRLDMDDRGEFKCKVTGRDGSGKIITQQGGTTLKVSRKKTQTSDGNRASEEEYDLTRPPTEKPKVTTQEAKVTTEEAKVTTGLGDITISMNKTVWGSKRKSVVIPCTYTTSNIKQVVKIKWEFGNRTVIYRSESEDRIPLVKYRTRASISKSSAGDVSLTLKKLDTDDRGEFKCKVTGRDGSGKIITQQGGTTLKLRRTRPPTGKPKVATEEAEETTEEAEETTEEAEETTEEAEETTEEAEETTEEAEETTEEAEVTTEDADTETPNMETTAWHDFKTRSAITISRDVAVTSVGKDRHSSTPENIETTNMEIAETSRHGVHTKILLTAKPDVKVTSSGGEPDKTPEASHAEDDSSIVSTQRPRRFHSSTISTLPLTTNVMHENPAAEAIKGSGIFFYVLIIGFICLISIAILAIVLLSRMKRRKSFTYNLPSMNQLALNLEERRCGGGGCQSSAEHGSNHYEPCFPASQYESLPISSEYEQLILKNAEENVIQCETSESCAQSV